MRREGPLFFSIITGLVSLVAFFSPALENMNQRLLVWFSIVSGFALILGIESLLRMHAKRLRKSPKESIPSLFLLLGFLVTLALGIYSSITVGDIFNPRTPFMWIYNYILVPLQSTMFSLLAFFIASAAYRAFRVKNLEATLLFITSTIVMLGRVPIGKTIYHNLPLITEWIMKSPSMAAQRGIMIGIALGSIGMSLRILLGIERPYLR